MNLESCINNGRLKVLVKPNAKKTEIIEISKGLVKIAVAAVPDKNKANTELARFFSKVLKKKIKIISGKTSRNKTLEITS